MCICARTHPGFCKCSVAQNFFLFRAEWFLTHYGDLPPELILDFARLDRIGAIFVDQLVEIWLK